MCVCVYRIAGKFWRFGKGSLYVYASKILVDFNLAVTKADHQTAKFSGYMVCTCSECV